MTKCGAGILALDHSHCRAICDEIGERLRRVLKPQALEIPQRLRSLLDRLAEIEQVPSIIPTFDETSFERCSDTAAGATRSLDRVAPATNRTLAYQRTAGLSRE
jgi:hypothetical protein